MHHSISLVPSSLMVLSEIGKLVQLSIHTRPDVLT